MHSVSMFVCVVVFCGSILILNFLRSSQSHLELGFRKMQNFNPKES